ASLAGSAHQALQRRTPATGLARREESLLPLVRSPPTRQRVLSSWILRCHDDHRDSLRQWRTLRNSQLRPWQKTVPIVGRIFVVRDEVILAGPGSPVRPHCALILLGVRFRHGDGKSLP